MTADATVPHVPMDSPEWAEVKDYIAKLKAALPASAAVATAPAAPASITATAVTGPRARLSGVYWYRRLWGSAPPPPPPPPPELLSEEQISAVLKSITAVPTASAEEEKGRVAILESFLRHHPTAKITAEQGRRLGEPFKWGFAMLPLLRGRIIDPENNHVIYARFRAWAVPKAKRLLEG